MRFTIAINLERMSPDTSMEEMSKHSLQMVQMADQAGFDIVWTAEHHAVETTIAPAPFQLLAFWGAHAKRIRLGTAVAVAPYWHPIKLAGEAAMLDLLSGGRLELGIGRGAYQREFDRMAGGIQQQKGVAYMQEMLPAIRALWQEGDYAHDGAFWSFPASTSVPKPVQKPLPRIWIGARDPATFDWAVQSGCHIMTWAISRPFSEVESLKARYETALQKNPKVPRPLFMTMRHTSVYEKHDDWRLPVESAIRQARRFENLFRNLGGVSNGFPEEVDDAIVANRADFAPELLRENLMFGTPDVVIDKLRRYEALGVDYFCYSASFGLPMAEQLRSLRLFIDEVMPAFAESTPRRERSVAE